MRFLCIIKMTYLKDDNFYSNFAVPTKAPEEVIGVYKYHYLNTTRALREEAAICCDLIELISFFTVCR